MMKYPKDTQCVHTMRTHLSTRAGALAGVITGASAMVYYGVAHLLCPPGSDAVMGRWWRQRYACLIKLTKHNPERFR